MDRMDNMELLIGLLLVGGAIGLVIYAVVSPDRTRSRSCATRCASSTATRSRTSATRSCWPRSASGRVAPGHGRPDQRSAAASRRSATPTTSARSSSQAGNGSADAVDRFLAIQVDHAGRSSSRWSGSSIVYNPLGLSRDAAARSCCLILAPCCSSAPTPSLNRRVEERQHDLRRQAARHPRPADHQRRGRPRLRAGARPHHRGRARRAVRRVRPHAGRGPGRCQPGRRHAGPRPAHQRARGPVVRAGHPPGRHLRRVHRAGPAGPGRGDAHQAPPAGPGAGPEGPGQDADPDGVLHLPGAVRGRDRPGHHQHPHALLSP